MALCRCAPRRTKVYFDIGIRKTGTTYMDKHHGVRVGDLDVCPRLVMKLRTDVAPKTCENFRALCTGEKGFGYKGTNFHSIQPEHAVQGGDITSQDGLGGRSIYGPKFRVENFELRHLDRGYLSMVNIGRDHARKERAEQWAAVRSGYREDIYPEDKVPVGGKDEHHSQFAITLASAPWRDGVHVVFGHIVAGADALTMMEARGAQTGQVFNDVAYIADCGELSAEEAAKYPDAPLESGDSGAWTYYFVAGVFAILFAGLGMLLQWQKWRDKDIVIPKGRG